MILLLARRKSIKPQGQGLGMDRRPFRQIKSGQWMAIITLDDSDPVDAIALAYRDEMNARRSEGAFFGAVSSETLYQHGDVAEWDVITRRRQKRVAAPRGK